MKVAVGGFVVEFLSLAVGEPVASPQQPVATDVKITLSWKGMTGWMWRKGKKRNNLSKTARHYSTCYFRKSM